MTRWPTHEVFSERFDNPERIRHLAGEVLPALKALHDALEVELMSAVSDEDKFRAAKVAWLYGPVAALITELETETL